MSVVLINPNSTDAMTQSALKAARATSPGIDFEGWTSRKGPSSIEGPMDGERATPPLLNLVRKASDDGATAIIIACFDDTGLAEAQRISSCPVIGIGQASYMMAALLAHRAAVVTTVEAAVPVIRGNIASYGFSNHIQYVRAANVHVLSLAREPKKAIAGFQQAIHHLPNDTQTVILGCSAAVSIVNDLQQQQTVNIIDGVTAASRLVRALV